MNLFNKIRTGIISGGLAGILFLQGCAAYRDGNQRISYCALPFLGYAFKTEEFKEKSNEIESANEILISSKGCDLKQYGEKMKYSGMWRARTQKHSKNLLVSHYDSRGRLIKEQEGLPDDAPKVIMIRID